MESSPIQISHDRLVRLKPIEENHQQFLKDQKRYFIYEIDDNKWQNTNPDGSDDYDLEFIKQEKAVLPIGILSVDQNTNDFSFEGDLTVTKDDQVAIFNSLPK
ncbi:MAG: hypothetical protein EOP44_00710 [Sphingobacteriaceae bacterium]|nr:MAG: hypothetical protein EOP44_00710 [Sphingobacteriaceae bacterium]